MMRTRETWTLKTRMREQVVKPDDIRTHVCAYFIEMCRLASDGMRRCHATYPLA